MICDEQDIFNWIKFLLTSPNLTLNGSRYGVSTTCLAILVLEQILEKKNHLSLISIWPLSHWMPQSSQFLMHMSQSIKFTSERRVHGGFCQRP